LGTNDLSAATRFYDATLSTLGIVRLSTQDSEVGYGLATQDDPSESTDTSDRIKLWITTPYDGRPATVGNGSMPALASPTRAAVDAFYNAGLSSGGTDEGAPGIRYRPNFYSCYLRDPDGNKISAVCLAP
jgi:catechol 2,3-dioxygenase-like lactoylglutathione lyase family enzyme